MKNIKFAAAIGAAALILTACGGNASDSAKSDSKKSDYTACLVSDAGGWDDKSFNQSAKEGLDAAIKEFGVNEKTAESKGSSDFAPNVTSMVDSGCNVVIGVGYNLADAIGGAAKENQDIDFALVDSGFDEKYAGENTRALLFNTQEAAFLAGYAAAAFSKTGAVGTFGGIKIPSVTIFMDGFADGVAAYNADSGKNVKVLGWSKESQDGLFTNSFDDQALGTQVGGQLIQQGADVIMPVAGPVGLGAAAAAKNAGNVYIVGVDSDWYLSAPEYKDIVLTSVMKGIGASVKDTVKAGADGKFSSEPYVGTLANGGVSIAPFHDFESKLPEGLKAKLDELQKSIVDGKIKVESKSSN